MSLVENASQRADWDLVLPWHNRGINHAARVPYKLHVAAFLAGLDETSFFKAAFDLTER